MNDIPNNATGRRHQCGQSTIEYAIISAVLVTCLFALNSRPGRDMAQAISTFYTDLTFFLSLP